ncbi:MAG: hypothetical protein FWD40_01410 [Treponema sp.]|nr:hypothetical protein [Treponema sp.]
MKRGCTIKKLPLFIIALLITSALFAQGEATVGFHNFAWGTSMDTFKARMGNPVHTDVFNGFQSLIYENVQVSGYQAFMVAFFSRSGLEGGTYYFDTKNIDELRQCYTTLQDELVLKYGPTLLHEAMLREVRTYETSWNLSNGYIYLKVNTRGGDPVTLWYSSPSLTRILNGS